MDPGGSTGPRGGKEKRRREDDGRGGKMGT